ncbi:hypothetical protein, partial [Proteus mirabilis]|uniref:hypothetical protein n=1 Tax=Proteus mirabilis TaxID=584 RepID=UPI001C12FCC9
YAAAVFRRRAPPPFAAAPATSDQIDWGVLFSSSRRTKALNQFWISPNGMLQFQSPSFPNCVMSKLDNW